MRAMVLGRPGGADRVLGASRWRPVRETGCPSEGHLRMAHANCAIPRVNCFCAVSGLWEARTNDAVKHNGN